MSEKDPKQEKIEELQSQIRELQRAASSAAESAEIAKVLEMELEEEKRKNAALGRANAKLEATLRELSRASTTADADTLTELGSGAVQLAQSVTVEVDGIRYSAKTGDVLTADKAAVPTLEKRARPHRLAVYVVSKATIEEVRRAGLVRGV
jgi:hypothetical protein